MCSLIFLASDGSVTICSRCVEFIRWNWYSLFTGKYFTAIFIIISYRFLTIERTIFGNFEVSFLQFPCNKGSPCSLNTGLIVLRRLFYQYFNFNFSSVQRCSGIPLLRCSAVPLFHCSSVPLFRCSAVSLFRCSAVPLFRCSTVPLFRRSSITDHQ